MDKMIIKLGLLLLEVILSTERIIVQEYKNNRELVRYENIPNYPGLYFVPQYWFLMSSESWEVLYNVPMKPLTARLTLIEDIWKELLVHKQNHTMMWSSPKFDILGAAIKNLHDTYDQFNNLLLNTESATRRKRGIFNSLVSLKINYWNHGLRR